MLVFLTLTALGLIAYSNSFGNSFHLDDLPYIVNNPAIRNFVDLHQIAGIEPTRIVTYFTFALNYHWGALNLWGFHAFNLCLHVINAILVWQLMRLTFTVLKVVEGSAWMAFFTAAIFLTHPLQTQAVNYIYQRAVLLAAFFYLSSLVLFIKANLVAPKNILQRELCYGGSLICACLCMLSKESAVSLPVMILFYQYFIIKDQKSFGWQRILPFFVSALIIPFAWGRLNFHSLLNFTKTAEGISQGWTVKQYALTQGPVIVTYLRLLFLPLHQRADYDYTPASSFMDGHVFASFILLGVVLGAAFAISKKHRLLSFGICWFFIALLPESSFWPNRDLVYEHRLYLPLLGFALFLSAGLFLLFGPKRVSITVRVLLVVVVAYVFLSYQRNKVWKDEFSLWDNVAQESPRDSRAFLNRGAAYQAIGDLDHAMADYNTVLGLGLADAVTLSNRGYIFAKHNDNELALANYNFALKINPNYAGTYVNRGLLYKRLGKYDLAVADFNKAIEFMPDDKRLYFVRDESYLFSLIPDEYQQDVLLALRKAGPHASPLIEVLQNLNAQERREAAFLIANMPDVDLVSLNKEMLMANIHLAYQVMREVPWAGQVPEDIFLNDILPYASLNERRDDWRADFHERFLKVAQDSKSIDEAVLKLNKYVFETLKVQYSADKRPKPDQSPYESIDAHYASCTGLSILLTDVLRSVGIPARIAAIAMWPDESGNHTWVEIWDGRWHYLGSSESTQLDKAWFTTKAAHTDAKHPIYATSFKKTATSFPMRWAPELKYVPAVDVTASYVRFSRK